LELLAPGHLAHLAPGCHHKVFGAASNVVYSYAGPSLTGVNHRAGNMDLGMGWSLMSGGEKSRRQRKFLFQRRTFDRGHWLYFELMVDMQKSQPLGTVGLADRPIWKPLPNCFFYFLCAFRAYMTAPSTLGGAEPISTAHLRPEDFPRVFLINVPLQAETPA